MHHVGSIVHEDLDMRKLSAKWVPKCQRGSQTSSVPVVWVILYFFSARSKWFPAAIGDHGRNLVISLWPETKQQSVEWRHSGSPRPKKFREQKSAGKFLASIFWDQDGILLTDYLPNGQTLNAEFTHLCWCNWRIFWRKNTTGRSPRVSCSRTKTPRLTGHLQPRRNWLTLTSNVLIIHPILRTWPHRTSTCTWT